jgi:hypothetical protein
VERRSSHSLATKIITGLHTPTGGVVIDCPGKHRSTVRTEHRLEAYATEAAQKEWVSRPAEWAWRPVGASEAEPTHQLDLTE